MAEDTSETGASSAQEEPGKAQRAAEGVSHEEMAELRELTSSLLQAVGAMQAQDARSQQFRSLAEDVRTAARTLAVAAPAARGPVPGYEEQRDDCGCGPCSCLSSACCLFEIRLTHARVTEMQLPTEPFDSNVNPFAEMEVRLFASIGGIGAVIPNLWSTLLLRKNLMRPGLWSPVGIPIGTVSVCRGKSQIFTIDVQAVEVDDGGVEALGVRDEYGSGSEDMVLDCCVSMPIEKDVGVQLDNGGLGGGAIEAKFEARKICC